MIEMQQNIVITGANKGIGLELAKAYQTKGEKVFALVRKSSKELDAIDGITVIQNIDLGTVKDFSVLDGVLSSVHIDILINNAGILTKESLGQIDYDQVQNQFLVNAIGPLRLTEYLIPQLHKGSKVALITSRMGSLSDNTSGGSYGYRASKAALNTFGVSLACDLEPKGVAVGIFHPGFVKTTMVGNQGDINAEEAARRLMQRIEELNLKNTGSFKHANGEKLPW
jgi:short-subunit dehydrogenase